MENSDLIWEKKDSTLSFSFEDMKINFLFFYNYDHSFQSDRKMKSFKTHDPNDFIRTQILNSGLCNLNKWTNV